MHLSESSETNREALALSLVGQAGGELHPICNTRTERHFGVRRTCEMIKSGRMKEEQPAVTLLLQAWKEGDSDALSQLIPLVYGELKRLAAAHLARHPANQTLQPTALVHEAYLRLAGGQPPRLSQQRAFPLRGRAHHAADPAGPGARQAYSEARFRTADGIRRVRRLQRSARRAGRNPGRRAHRPRAAGQGKSPNS